MKRKAVVQYLSVPKKVSLAKVHRDQVNKAHRHACTNPSCRLTYQDSCFTPERNGRCQPCRGMRRTWVDVDGLTALDPRPCCVDNSELMTSTDELARYECAGPGPWFQCRTCCRTHGHPCTDPDLLARPLQIHNPEGTS